MSMLQEHQRVSIFQAQTRNVRELRTVWAHVNRQINISLVQKNSKALETNTKLLALVYCALSETIFSKMVHTPNGLSLNDIDQIKVASNEGGVKLGWTKCADLALKRVESRKSNHQPNVRRKLLELIDKLIYDPSIVRNKLAHGQWLLALNRENTSINEEITKELARLSVVDLYRREHSLRSLAAIIEDIIESPNKAHPRDYWLHLSELEAKELAMSRWTIEYKLEQLLLKKSYCVPRSGCEDSLSGGH